LTYAIRFLQRDVVDENPVARPGNRLELIKVCERLERRQLVSPAAIRREYASAIDEATTDCKVARDRSQKDVLRIGGASACKAHGRQLKLDTDHPRINVVEIGKPEGLGFRVCVQPAFEPQQILTPIAVRSFEVIMTSLGTSRKFIEVRQGVR